MEKSSVHKDNMTDWDTVEFTDTDLPDYLEQHTKFYEERGKTVEITMLFPIAFQQGKTYRESLEICARSWYKWLETHPSNRL